MQAVAMGTMNKLATENRAVANGLYISIYYTGAALGSWLPGLIYQAPAGRPSPSPSRRPSPAPSSSPGA